MVVKKTPHHMHRAYHSHSTEIWCGKRGEDVSEWHMLLENAQVGRLQAQ